MNKRSKAAYGVLGAPLAMAALPVYIYTPKLYGDEFGLGLALTGLILLFSRIVDTLQDPWLGKLADYLQPRPGGWSRMISVSALLLGVAFIALFNPPALSKVGLVTWLGVSLILVYTAHSALNITYLAWGARASEDSHERTSIVASREGFGLAGVILASLLPMIFGFWLDGPWRWLAFSLAFIAVLLLGTWLLNNHVPKPQGLAGRSRGILHPLRHAQFRRLAFLFLINGLAVAVAATLALFYISDILKLESHTGILLALYFISGAASLPLWLGLSRRLGKPVTWAISTLVAVSPSSGQSPLVRETCCLTLPSAFFPVPHLEQTLHCRRQSPQTSSHRTSATRRADISASGALSAKVYWHLPRASHSRCWRSSVTSPVKTAAWKHSRCSMQAFPASLN